VAEWIADLADDLASEEKHGWCSACFGDHLHRKANRPLGHLPAYLCNDCGSPTLRCADPGCKNMAVRGQGAIRVKRYCAEHRHEIPGFAKADRKMGALNNYEEFLKYDKPNLARAVRVVGFAGAGLAVGAPLAFLAAPAIGGAVGALLGSYTGAAATSYGLALLGGGALAVGGLGMAGGTLVITALGASLGCALGASVMNAYVREDRSFHIEMLQGGRGIPVIVCNGFLSESGRGWGEWHDIITKRYADSPVYRVHWGAKELKDLGFLGAGGAAVTAGVAALKEAAMKAAKMAARRLGPLGPALVVTDLAKNPWHVAKNRAEKTGVIVADLLARTNADSYVLVGHSLGARAMVVAAQTLGTKPGGPRVQAIHLLGAAIGAKSDWHTLTAAVDDAVYNYHSTNDSVLKFVYPVAQGGRKAAGLTGFRPSANGLKNIDVSAQVKSHFDYHKNVILN
jgi:pimeloyl-ACP methyl ester carboxylesterase